MSITIESTTDTPEQVTAAMGGLNKGETVVEEKAESGEKSQDESSEEEQQDESATSKDSEDEDQESQSRDGEEEEDQDSEEDKGKGEDGENSRDSKKKGSRAEKRIKKLASRLSEKDQEIAFLRSQLERSTEKKSPEDDSSQQVDNSQSSGEPQEEDFENHKDYVKALAKWTYEQEKKADEEKNSQTKAKSDYEKKLSTHSERVAEFKKEHSDFDDVVADLVEEYGDVKFSGPLEASILSSENGPALVYELAKNPDQLMRINKLNALDCAREIGKIEARLEKNQESPPKQKKATTTKAPPPVKPVGGKSTRATAKSIYDENLSFAEYEKLRSEQMRSG